MPFIVLHHDERLTPCRRSPPASMRKEPDDGGDSETWAQARRTPKGGHPTGFGQDQRQPLSGWRAARHQRADITEEDQRVRTLTVTARLSAKRSRSYRSHCICENLPSAGHRGDRRKFGGLWAQNVETPPEEIGHLVPEANPHEGERFHRSPLDENRRCSVHTANLGSLHFLADTVDKGNTPRWITRPQGGFTLRERRR